MSRTTPNTDVDLERAMAAEAVYAYERYMAFGIAPGEYSLPALRDVVQAAADAWEVDGAVTIETVAKALQRAGKLVALGGADGLADMLESPAVADADEFVRLRRLRMLREAALRVATEAERGELHAALSALGEAQTSAIETARMGDTVDLYDLGCELLENLQQKRVTGALVHPGWEMLQRAAKDIPVGSLVVIGGGTNVGKSSFAIEMIVRAAQRSVTCGYISCEDPRLLVCARFMSVFTGLSSAKLALGTMDEGEFKQLAAGYEPVRGLRGRVKLSFAVGGTDIDVCAAMSRAAMQGAKLIVVDYVQAIDASKRQQDRRNEIRWLCARLKAHAQRLNVVLVLLSQLGRPGKGDEGREPTKHDLKEAGDLENAAEYVVLLWRETVDDFADVNVKLEKSKFGGIGTRWKVARDGRTARLEEVDGTYESAADRRRKGLQ